MPRRKARILFGVCPLCGHEYEGILSFDANGNRNTPTLRPRRNIADLGYHVFFHHNLCCHELFVVAPVDVVEFIEHLKRVEDPHEHLRLWCLSPREEP